MHDRGEGRASFGMCRNLNQSVSCSGGSICYCLLRIGCISQLRCFKIMMANLKLSCFNTFDLLCLEVFRVPSQHPSRHNDGTIPHIHHGRSNAEGVPSITTQPTKEGSCALCSNFSPKDASVHSNDTDPRHSS